MENKIIKAFVETLEELRDEGWAIEKAAPWTKFLVKVMEGVGEKTDCRVQAKGLKDPHNSGEYLNIDVLLFRKSDYKEPLENLKSNDYDEPVLPIAAVELENDYQRKQIVYCLWKLSCLRVSTRLLVCYQTNEDNLKRLRNHLEKTIFEYGLMDRDNGSLFVIIGDERAIKRQKWCDYYRAFEWNNNKLNEIKIFQN